MSAIKTIINLFCLSELILDMRFSAFFFFGRFDRRSLNWQQVEQRWVGCPAESKENKVLKVDYKFVVEIAGCYR